MYPRVDDIAGKIVVVYLSCIGTMPSTAVDFQLWIHKYKDADKSIVRSRYYHLYLLVEFNKHLMYVCCKACYSCQSCLAKTII